MHWNTLSAISGDLNVTQFKSFYIESNILFAVMETVYMKSTEISIRKSPLFKYLFRKVNQVPLLSMRFSNPIPMKVWSTTSMFSTIMEKIKKEEEKRRRS